jgi:hypothetical protein
MNLDIQAHITSLQQFLKTMHLATVKKGHQVQAENPMWIVEVQPINSIVSIERHVMKIAIGALEFPKVELQEEA